MKSRALETSQTQFEGLHEALDSVRDSTPTVKVDKEALQKVLVDYGRMVAALKWPSAMSFEDLL